VGHQILPLRLSICIATLNRCEFLAETIGKFAEQMLDGVELVVVDGGSADGTQTMVEQAKKKYPWISYHRLSTNGGIDADYDKSVQLAQGQYCWMFSDDDWPLPGALKAIYGACGQGHDFVFADAQVRDVKMQEIFLERRSKLTQDQTLCGDDMDTLFKLTGSALSFIGSCIVRRDIWLARDCKSYYGYYFPHIAIVFQQPLRATSLLLYEPLIAIRYGNATWTGSAFKIWMLLWPRLVWKMASISDIAKASVTALEPWRSTSMLMWQRAKGTYTPVQYRDFLAVLPMSKIMRMKLQLISVVPGTLAAVLALIAVQVSHKPRKYLIEELRLSPYCQGSWIKRLMR
jgi:abequosyltransferase